MEGLLLAQMLAELPPLPQPHGKWRFPDAGTFVLPVLDLHLWLLSVPPNPLLEVRAGSSRESGLSSSFQQLLAARTNGELLSARQLKLDRVVRFEFGPGNGFVSTPPISLVAELTGRNCNLILLDDSGRILGVQREVGSSTNRYRQLLPGVVYRQPPEYDRPDPRQLGAEAVAAMMTGKKLANLRKHVDGIGPELTATVAILADLPLEHVITEDDSGRLTGVLDQLLADPRAAREQALGQGGVVLKRREDERAELLGRLVPEQKRKLELLKRRLNDIERLGEVAERSAELRQQADLLLAWRPAGEPGSQVHVQDWEGNEVTVQLEPRLDAVKSAEVLYTRARRHEQRHETALKLIPDLKKELAVVTTELAQLEDRSLTELRKLVAALPVKRGQHRTEPGIRVTGPHGFEILIGRNARDNDKVTFGLARSRDIWLHVQGYRGSHVIVRAQNREVPFDTILFAAQLAAGHSQAAESDNVPVDYALRKNVWRPKGAAAGAVHFTDQKTVFVTPLKRATPEAPAEG